MGKKATKTLAAAERAFIRSHAAEMKADSDPRCTVARHARACAASDAARKVRDALREAARVSPPSERGAPWA